MLALQIWLRVWQRYKSTLVCLSIAARRTRGYKGYKDGLQPETLADGKVYDKKPLGPELH